MLTHEENIHLTQTGKGTPMGELLRRYWNPIAAVTEFEDRSTKQVRLMGEDLVLYKDRSGTYGLLGLHCPHRRADLSYGFVEEGGLRCSYHGWAFDEKGSCIAQPFEDTVNSSTRFRDAIKQVAYPVQEMAGLLFAYLGPAPAPLLPRWELFDYANGFKQIVFSDVACNWLQAAENNIDPVHFEWLHSNWTTRLSGKDGPYAATHVRLGFDEWEFGFGYRRIVENTDEADQGWQMPRLAIMPNLFMPGGTHFEWRVPVDDDNTLSVVWDWVRVPMERDPFVQERIPHWYAQITDPVTNRWISSHVINQDTIAWVGQGVLADRENEHLGRSDEGVVMFRDQLRRDLDAVAKGDDPKGVLRDASKNNPVRWPDDRRARIERGLSKDKWLEQQTRLGSPLRATDDYFRFLAGQPEDVRIAFRQAVGLE